MENITYWSLLEIVFSNVNKLNLVISALYHKLVNHPVVGFSSKMLSKEFNLYLVVHIYICEKEVYFYHLLDHSNNMCAYALVNVCKAL